MDAPTITNSQHGALFRADGTTQLTHSAGAALISAAPNADPDVVVAEDIYEDRVFEGTVYPAHERVLKFRAGQVIKQSQWDAAFPAATVTSVSPASGPAAGGTPVTVHGTNFTPGSTLTFGGAAATSVVVVSPQVITCHTPAHAAGVVNVVVTTDAAATATGTAAFTYV